MYRCLIWGSGKVFQSHLNLLKLYEIKNEIELKGIATNDTFFNVIDGIPVISKEKINSKQFDLVIVMSNMFFEIEQEAIARGFTSEQIISYKTFLIPNMRIEKYIDLKKSNISIFAPNCWGGLTYHQVGIKFLSPFINLFLLEEDYLKFLKAPHDYLKYDLVLDRMSYNETLQIEYPVCKCGDIDLYFNHYPSFEEAKKCWDKRKDRINWENLFVMFFTENLENAKIFDALPYEKKICFVPFKCELESVHTLDFLKKNKEQKNDLWEVINGMANGTIYYYDVVNLLLTGTIETKNI